MIADLFLIIAFSGAMIATVVYFTEDLLDPITIFTLLNSTRFLMRPAVIMLGIDLPENMHLFRMDVQELARETMLIFFLGYLSFALGYGLANGRLSRRLATYLMGYRPSIIRVARLNLLTLIVVTLSGVMSVYYIITLGGLGNYMTEARLGLFAGTAYLQHLPELAVFIAALALYIAFRRRRGFLIPALAFFFSLVFLFMMGERGGIISAFLFLAVLYHFGVRRLTVWNYLAFGLVLSLLLAGLGMARKEIMKSDEGTTVSTSRMLEVIGDDEQWSALSVLQHLNANATDHFMVIVQDFDITNYTYGDDFYRGLIGVIPRAIWPDKPERITTGQWFTERYFPGKPSGRPITTVGIYYLNFGYVGVFLGMLISGAFCRILWHYLKGVNYRPWPVILYLTFMFRILSWGTLTPTLPMDLILVFMPIYLAYHLTTTRAAGPSRAGGAGSALSMAPQKR